MDYCRKENTSFVDFNVNILTELMKKLSSMYDDVFSISNVVNTIVDVMGAKIYVVPLLKEIEYSLTQQIKIRKGNLYNYVFKLMLSEYCLKDYVVLNDSYRNSKFIVNDDNECLEVDLLFKNSLDDTFFCELKTLNNHDNGKKKSIVDSFKKLKSFFSKKYNNLTSYIVYIEEDSEEYFKYIEIDSSEKITGRTFFKKFFNMDIDIFFNKVNDIIDRLDVDKHYDFVKDILYEYINYPERFTKYVSKEHLRKHNYYIIKNKKNY